MRIGFLDIVLILLCLALLLISGFFMMHLIKRQKQCVQLRKDLELQKKRVLARKEKIGELRQKLHDLAVRLSEDERKLLNSYSQEELGVLYPEIIEALQHLLQIVEIDRLPPARQTDAISAAIRLSHLLQAAFRMSEEPVLAWENAGREGGADPFFLSRRVLIVDDNEESRRFSAEVVESGGFLADLAASGEEAVEKVRSSREGYYCLILMDVIMHDQNGYETCREIRKLPRVDCERIPVIAMTANSFSEDYVQLVDAGMNDRISKPISRESFLGVSDKWLRNRQVVAPTGEGDITWSSILTSDGSAATSRR